MFASVLGGDASRQQQRWGTGVVLSALFHAAVITAAILYAPRADPPVPYEEKPDPGPIYAVLPGDVAGRLGDLPKRVTKQPGKTPRRAHPELTLNKNNAVATPVPDEEEVEVGSPVDLSTLVEPGTTPTIGKVGVPWGRPDGDPDSVSSGPTGVEVYEAGRGMEPPALLSGDMPQYTKEAVAARVEGTLIVQCIITPEGVLQACRIVKGVPHMDAEVLRALRTQRYRPVYFQGRPIAVRYTLRFNLKLPGR